MHITVAPHHSENKPFQNLNYSSSADCSGTSNFLTNHHLNNDVFSPLLPSLSEKESFHSLERDLHSNSSLRGLESPSSNSMIIRHSHSQPFFSERPQRGRVRGVRGRKCRNSTVYFRQFIQPVSIRIQNISTFNQGVLCEAAVISSQDEQMFQSNHPRRVVADRASSNRDESKCSF